MMIGLSSFWIFTLVLGLETGPAELVRAFPEDEEMDRHQFLLSLPSSMEVTQNGLYVLDQGEHGVHIFDLEGNYRKTFGGYGQGPGYMVWPNTLTVSDDEIAVFDKQGFIHLFDLEGSFKRRIKILDFIRAFSHTKYGFLGYMIDERSGTTFIHLDRNGRRLGGDTDYFVSRYEEYKYDFGLQMARNGKEIFFMQRYGRGFRVYDNVGSRKAEGKVEVDPFDDSAHKEYGVMYTYSAFDVMNERLMAVSVARGGFVLWTFAMDGKLLKRTKIPIEVKEADPDVLIHLQDFELHRQNDKTYAYLLTVMPFVGILRYELRMELFGL